MDKKKMVGVYLSPSLISRINVFIGRSLVEGNKIRFSALTETALTEYIDREETKDDNR